VLSIFTSMGFCKDDIHEPMLYSTTFHMFVIVLTVVCAALLISSAVCIHYIPDQLECWVGGGLGGTCAFALIVIGITWMWAKWQSLKPILPLRSIS